MRAKCAVGTTCALLMLNGHALAQAPDLAGKARQSIVYIYFDVTDPNTGAKSTIQGTGFIVSQRGYTLTAAHLFTDWVKQIDVDRDNNGIWGSLRDRPGYTTSRPLVLEVVNRGDSDAEDMALLKLPDPGSEYYPVAPYCLAPDPTVSVGAEITAYGFPEGRSFQPISGRLGTQNAPGGRWYAASAFTLGMSGGPVYSASGRVMGMIKGGSDNSDAVRWIAPIELARRFPLQEQCPAAPGNPDATYRLAIEAAVAHNDPEAVRLYRISAEQGNVEAMHDLAVRYAMGRGITKDPKEALRWYRMAAAKGQADSMYLVGLRYLNGDQVIANNDEAAVWILQAIQYGSEDALAEMTTKFESWRDGYRLAFQKLLRKRTNYVGPVDGKLNAEMKASVNGIFNTRH